MASMTAITVRRIMGCPFHRSQMSRLEIQHSRARMCSGTRASAAARYGRAAVIRRARSRSERWSEVGPDLAGVGSAEKVGTGLCMLERRNLTVRPRRMLARDCCHWLILALNRDTKQSAAPRPSGTTATGSLWLGATLRTASNRASPRRNFCGPDAAHHRSWIYDSRSLARRDARAAAGRGVVAVGRGSIKCRGSFAAALNCGFNSEPPPPHPHQYCIPPLAVRR
jgi:hypothetical protein